tara:strand:- start:435 stop:2918 length:2484 start_codon:yes stop_codon:yes gene_type:complete
MVRPAVHLGGSGLEYKSIKPTDWLTPLKENYQDQTRILNKQAALIEEQGRQEIAKAAAQDKLLMKIGGLIPAFMANAGNKKAAAAKVDEDILKSDLLQLYNTPEKMEAAAQYLQIKRTEEFENHKDYANIVATIGDPIAVDKLKNMSAAHELITQQHLGIRFAKSLTHDKYLEFRKNLTGSDIGPWASDKDIAEIPNEIDRLQVENLTYEDWVLQRTASFKPSNGAFSDGMRKEIEKLFDTRRNRVTAEANKLVLTGQKRKHADWILGIGDKTENNPDPTKDGERLVEAIQLIYNDITPNYTLTKDGVTPTQQATEYLGKLFYDLGKAGILKDSVANKLVVSNSLRNHAGGKNLPDAFWDKEGRIYQAFNNGLNDGRALNFEIRKNEYQSQTEIKIDNLINNWDKLEDPAGAARQLEYELNNTNLAKTEHKTLIKNIIDNKNNFKTVNDIIGQAELAVENGGLLDHLDKLESLGEFGDHRPLLLRARSLKKINEKYNYTTDDLRTRTISNRNGIPYTEGSKETALGKQVTAERIAVKEKNLMEQLKPYWDPKLNEYVDVPLEVYLKNIEFEALDWKLNGGGETGTNKRYSVSQEKTGDYTNLNKYTKWKNKAKGQFSVKLNDKGAKDLWDARLADPDKSDLDPEDLVSVFQTEQFHDEIVYKAHVRDITPAKFVHNELKALLNSNDKQDKRIVELFNLKEIDKRLNDSKDPWGLTFEQKVLESLPPNSLLSYKMTRIGFMGLQPTERIEALNLIQAGNELYNQRINELQEALKAKTPTNENKVAPTNNTETKSTENKTTDQPDNIMSDLEKLLQKYNIDLGPNFTTM